MIAQWQSAATGTKMVNLAQVEAIAVTGAGPYTLQAVNGANTYALDGFSYASSALAFAGIQQLLGVGNPPTDPTVTTGNVHDV